ncbi:MAG: cyclic nucleotide-binding domain-containing protein, partial [Gammaproteobacteria bacterium]|nr:cyclic nucleotide-binding domain-containing protein [Gammaproteobacteria bacterium]
LPQGFLGRTLGVVQQGEVEIFQKTPEGDETIHGILQAGQVFGERSLFGDPTPRNTGLRARVEVRILLLDLRELIRHFQHHPDFAYSVLQDLCRRITILGEDLQSSKSPTVDVQ